MQPPRRPAVRPSNAGTRPPRNENSGHGAARQIPQQETQHVLRKPPPQNNNAREVWLLARRRIRLQHVAILALVVLVFFITRAIGDARIRAMQAELEHAKDYVKQAQTEVAEKERRLQFSGSDEYVEQQARLRFGYINEGEIRFLPDTSLTNDFGSY